MTNTRLVDTRVEIIQPEVNGNECDTGPIKPIN